MVTGACKVPFLSPFLRPWLRASATVEAGPIQLSKVSRLPYHPGGNPFGPAISFQLTATVLRSPRADENQGSQRKGAGVPAPSTNQ
jgi:hypothetical protein